MGKSKKSTKKFNKSNLKDELKNRRKGKQVKAKMNKRSASSAQQTGSNTIEMGKPRVIKDKNSLEHLKLTGEHSVKKDTEDIFDAMDEVERESGGEVSEGDLEEAEDMVDSDDEIPEYSSDPEQSDDEDLEAEASHHKEDLDALKEKDPEFYKYLEANDKRLLDFELGEEEENDDESMEEEEASAKEEAGVVLTLKQIDLWEKELIKSKSLKISRELVLAFKLGAHLNQQTQEEQESQYIINSDKVFNRLMVSTMKCAPIVFNHHLSNEKKTDLLPTASPKWTKLRALVKSYLESLLHILTQVTEPSMIKFMLERTQPILKYIACFPKLMKSFLKSWLHYFGTSPDDSTQLVAFSLIRKLSILSAYALDISLKGVYTTYIRNAKSVTAHNILRLNVMRSCGVELFGHSFSKSYQLGFTSIRQLAIHLRGAINTKSKESYQQVYNWQFVYGLGFWAHVLATYANHEIESQHGPSPLRPLIYPLVQVALGAIRLIPSAKYFPLRFHCIRALLTLAQKTATFIPIAPYLIEVLESPEFQRRPSNSTAKPFLFDFTLKTPKEYLGTRGFQDLVIEEINELFLGYFSAISNSIAFPEITLPSVHYLKRFKKTSKNAKLSQMIEQIVSKIDSTAQIIQNHRAKLNFTPANIDKLDAYIESHSIDKTPIGVYYHKVIELKAARQAELNLVEESD